MFISFFVLIIFVTPKVFSKTPNLILIVADDVGWNDVGFHGSNQIPTPNIDALAYNGIILNRFYTSPSCTPSRAALLTGRYPIRLGLQGIPISAGENQHIPLDVPILPEKLKELGYSTHLVGKWHLGAAYRRVLPTDRGFDSHFGYWNGYVGYFNHESIGGNMTGLDMHCNLESVWNKRGQYVTRLLTREANKVIKNHDKTKPLFLMLSHLAGHTGKNGVELEVLDEEENNKRFDYIVDRKRRKYAGIIHELDKSIGSVMQLLSERNMLQNSIVVFLSDNGAQTVGEHENRGSNWPLRGLKMTVLEGGVRNIAVAYSPLFQHSNLVSNELIHITDILPTFYAAAGGNVEHLGNIDGLNQWNLLLHGDKSKRDELLVHIDEARNCSGYIGGEGGRYKFINGSELFENYSNYYGVAGRDGSSPIYNMNLITASPTNRAIRNGLRKYKMLELRNEATLDDCRNNIKYYDSCTHNNFCLFDLVNDPCETTNIAKDFPEIVGILSSKLLESWKLLKPQKKKYLDPRANPVYYNNSWYPWLDHHNIVFK